MASFKNQMMKQLSSFLYQRLDAAAQDILGQVEKALTLSLEDRDHQGTGLDFPSPISAAPQVCITFGDENQTRAAPAPQEARLSSNEETVLRTSAAHGKYLQETNQEGGRDVLQEQDFVDPFFEDVKQPERDKPQTDVVSYSDDSNKMCWVTTKVSEQTSNTKEEVIQSAEWPHCCGVCGNSFRCKSALRIHERAHRGDRPFQCDVCKKSFTKRSTLKRHERTHSGEKPYSCDICMKAFSDLTYFKKHQHTETGEWPYSCDMCGKAFSGSGTLSRHKCGHTAKAN